MFIYDRESLVMRKWQILEFDGKPYYAFVPENDEPFSTEAISPEVRKRDAQTVRMKEEIMTDDCAYDDENLENDSSFYNYNDENEGELSDNQPDNEKRPKRANSTTSTETEMKKKSLGSLYQVKVEGSKVTLERLEENVVEDNSMKILSETLKQEQSHEISDYEMNETLVEVNDEDDDENSLSDQNDEEDKDEEEMAKDDEDEESSDHRSLSPQTSPYPLSPSSLPEDKEVHEDVETAEMRIESQRESQNPRKPSHFFPTTSGPLKCKLCSETFGSAIAFRKHVAWTHKKKVCVQENGAYICSVCDYRTLKKSLFVEHLARKHETWTRKRQNSIVFPCEACGFVCRSKHSLQSHFIRKHTDRYEHCCQFCTKKFKVKGDLTNHIRFHHKEKPINCDVCGKLCQNTGSLYVHQKWAHYKPKYECHICKRRMVTQENLDQHLVSQHEQREKIVCAQCGKTFTKKDSFKRHMAVHTGSKPHPCPICTKPFARQSQLRQHVLIHTGQRPFVCDICGKGFTQKPGLICHRKTHPGVHAPLPVMPIAHLVREFIAQNEDCHPQDDDSE